MVGGRVGGWGEGLRGTRGVSQLSSRHYKRGGGDAIKTVKRWVLRGASMGPRLKLEHDFSGLTSTHPIDDPHVPGIASQPVDLP